MRSQFFTLSLLLVVLLSGQANSAEPSAADAGDSAEPTPPRFLIQRGLVYVERDKHSLRADVYVPHTDGPRPAVLVVHGGAWMTGRRTQLAGVARRLAEAGYTAVAISYRLAPRYPFPAQIDDCRAAVRWMRQNADRLKIDPQLVGGFGYSAGGHLVALLGTADEPAGPNALRAETDADSASANEPSTRIQAYVAGAAPCDFRILPLNVTALSYWLGGTRREKPTIYEQASPVHFVSADDPPAFFYHGTKDAIVPLVSSTAMVVALRQVGVTAELYQVADAGHIHAVFNQQAIRAGIEFLDRHLRDNDDQKE